MKWLISFAIVLFLIGTASASTLVVNKTFPACYESPEGLYFSTIQDAVNNASDGDTIIVCPGKYNEKLIVNKSLTIEGFDKENVILDGTGLSEKGISIEADSVTLRNLTICNFTQGNWPWGVELVGASNCTIEDLIVYNCTSGGINLYKGCHNNTVRNNLVKNCDGNGISIYGSSEGCCYNLIENNTIIDCAFAKTDGYRVPAICVFSGASYNIIRNNIIKQENETYVGKGRGITLWGVTYGGADMSETGNIIEYNLIENFDIGIYIIGVNLYTGSKNLVTNTTVRYNNLTKNNVGFKQIGFEGDHSSIALHYNNIFDNYDYGALVDTSYGTAILNATLNWWGDVSGPSGVGNGTGDAVSANVIYDPWLDSPYPEGEPINFTGVKSETVYGTTEIDAKTEADTSVLINATAQVNVTIAEYSRNPGSSFRGDIGKYIDVHIDDPGNVTSITIKLYYTDDDIAGLDENSLRMLWWNGETWVPCSNSGVNTTDQNGYSGYIWAFINDTTTPSLSDLQGTPFGGRGSPPRKVPVFNIFGLIALIGILNAVAIATLRKKII